jgi:Kelch motif
MAGTWQPLTHQPSFSTSTMLLLTDGRVMVQEAGTAHWHALTPDHSGSYVNGTWSSLADMSLWRTYYASGVLKDGRVFVCGGEYSGDVKDTKKGEIYDPVSDTWTSIPQPSMLPEVGDAACCVLPDGRVLVGALSTTACAIYDPGTNSWSSAGSTAVKSNEETWVLQRDGTVVTVQCFPPYRGEKYVSSTNTWKNEGSPPVTLVDPVMSEIGPAMLLYNGKTIFFGAADSGGNGKTAIYTPPANPTGTGTWAAGPNIPKVGGKTIVCNDCPASLLPNGKVLFTGAEWLNNSWGQPVLFFEYDPSTSTIAPVPTPSNNNAVLYVSRLMLLPSGEVLFSPSSNDIEVYSPDGAPQAAWRPTIASVTPESVMPGVIDAFVVTGTQLNGLSQANLYGDDCYPATNYPLVRLRDPVTNDVTYLRTYDFSTMGVATGASLQSCRFAPPNLPDGTYELTVIANGISSLPFALQYQRPRKPAIIDVGFKREFEHLGKIIYEGDPWDRRGWVVDPEIVELRKELRSLQNSVERLNTMIAATELPEVGAKIGKRTAAERWEGKPTEGKSAGRTGRKAAAADKSDGEAKRKAPTRKTRASAKK